EASVQAIAEMEKYLRIEAPFSGVITSRFAHPGSLAGPEGGRSQPLLRLEQVNRLRLVAPVPEAYIESIRKGSRVSFTVPAHPGRGYSGVVARPSYAVDSSTRTMPVELDVSNPSGELAPGMYAELSWPVSRKNESLFVPPSAIKTTTERIFVIRVTGGSAEWVDVRRGMTIGEKVEVFGNLTPGDSIVLRATDEIRPGTRVSAR
ncbi:MAG: efflux RND transporter periplasmic adaptor subunit, partial [bacterium]|nr:efflux RND transporter periplasmic adaptor subunit [bacterium]